MNAVVFSFSVQPGLAPVEGAAPWSVVGRQLPRLVVQTLNESQGPRADRGIRYFPFLGRQDGARGFLEFPEQLPVEALCKVHAQDPPPQVAIDGFLAGEDLKVRILDVEREKVLGEIGFPFDVRDVWPAVQRIHFEITSVLEWNDTPPRRPEDLDRVALSWLLVARDEQLALEANLIRSEPASCIHPVVAAFRRAPRSAEVRRTVVDLSRVLLKHGLARDEVAALAVEAFGACSDDAGLQETLASLVDAAGQREAAGRLWGELARARPVVVRAVRRAAGVAFTERRFRDGLELLRQAVDDARDMDAAGRISLLAQRMAFEEELGEVDARDATTEDLLSLVDGEIAAGRDLEPGPCRLLASALCGLGRYAEAERVAGSGVRSAPRHAGCWLELGRARIGLGETDKARMSFEQAVSSEPTAEVKAEVRRLQKLGSDDGTLDLMHRTERALQEGDHAQALALAESLRARRGDMPEAWLLLGVARQRSGKLKPARDAYREALRRDPDNGDAHNRLGILLAVAGKDGQALEHLSRATDLLPSEWSPRLHLAQVAWHLGRADEARQNLDRARALGAPPTKVAEAMRLCGMEVPGADGQPPSAG